MKDVMSLANIYIQITNRVVIVFTNGFGCNWKCIKGVQWKLCNLKIKLNTDQCLSNKIWGNYYTKHSVLQSWRKLFFFCLTLGQTGTAVLSYPWALCLSHHFFVILYITCQFFFFLYRTECQITYSYDQGLKLRKYFRGQVGPHQINFGSPHKLLGAHQVRIVRLTPRLQGALRRGVRWRPWDKWCKILYSGHFLAAKLAIQKL